MASSGCHHIDGPLGLQGEKIDIGALDEVYE
jgi:hypothetical protein